MSTCRHNKPESKCVFCMAEEATEEMSSGYRGRYIRVHDVPWAGSLQERHLLKLEVNGRLFILSERGPETCFSDGETWEVSQYYYNEGVEAIRSRESLHHLSQALRRLAELVEEQKF